MFKFSALSQIWKKYIQKLNDWDLSLRNIPYKWKRSRENTENSPSPKIISLLLGDSLKIVGNYTFILQLFEINYSDYPHNLPKTHATIWILMQL